MKIDLEKICTFLGYPKNRLVSVQDYNDLLNMTRNRLEFHRIDTCVNGEMCLLVNLSSDSDSHIIESSEGKLLCLARNIVLYIPPEYTYYKDGLINLDEFGIIERDSENPENLFWVRKFHESLSSGTGIKRFQILSFGVGRKYYGKKTERPFLFQNSLDSLEEPIKIIPDYRWEKMLEILKIWLPSNNGQREFVF